MRKILIIDGDYEFTRMVISFLESLKFEVAGANNLQEARAEIERFSPDLVLLSRELIGESGSLVPDGLDLLKEMKTHHRWKKIPVIFLVSEASESDLEKLRRLKHKADDYARKPLEDNDLLRRIENLIGFDPEETNSTLRMEMAKISESKADSGSGKTGLQSVAEKELRELFSRLGEELIEPEQEIDFALNVDELSKEQLKNELEFIQTQVRDKAKQDQRLREKWKKSIEALREKMLRLEQDKESMEEELDALRNEMERLRRKNQELLALLNRAQNFIQSIEQLKDRLNQETETLHDFLHDLERIRQK